MVSRLTNKINDKPLWGVIGILVSVTVASIAILLTFVFHSEDNSKFAARDAANKAAQQIVATKVLPPICKLAKGYADLPANTGDANSQQRSEANNANWAALSSAIGCNLLPH